MPKLIIQFDPSFYFKEIDDHANENILKPLTIGLNEARRDIEIQRQRVLHSNPFADISNVEFVRDEISRSETYRFPQVAEGAVTLESFRAGLARLGITQPQLRDFITLFVLQNRGAFLNRVGASVGQFVMNLDQNQNIYGTEASLEFIQIKLNSSLATQIKLNIYITQKNIDTGESTPVAKAIAIANINNGSLEVEYEPIVIDFDVNEELHSKIAKSLTDIGFKKSTGENPRASILSSNSEVAQNSVNPDFRIMPLSRAEIASQRGSNQITQHGYVFEPYGMGVGPGMNVGAPGTHRDKCIIQVELSKKQLLGISQYLDLSKSLSQQDQELKLYLPGVIRRLTELSEYLQTLNEEGFHQNKFRFFTEIMRDIHDIRLIFANSEHHKGQLSSSGYQALSMLEAVLAMMQTDEYFIYMLQNEQRAHYHNLQMSFKFQNELSLTANTAPAIQLSEQNEIQDFIKRAQYELDSKVNHATRAIDIGESYKVVIRVKHTLSWIGYKKIEFYEKMQKLAKQIGEMEEANKNWFARENPNLNKAKEQLKAFKRLFEHYDEAQNILRKSLGKLNCFLYTAERYNRNGTVGSVHPRTILANNDSPDAPTGYMEYLAWKTKKIFDGVKPSYTWFDYLNPFRTSSYANKLMNETKFLINEILLSDNLSPHNKLTQIKNLIERNKPASWRFWSSAKSEREEYHHLERQAHLMCLLDSFGRGYTTDDQFVASLTAFTDKNRNYQANNINQFIADFKDRYKENKKGKNDEIVPMLSQNITSAAKACQFLINPRGGYLPHFMADLFPSVKRVMDADKSINPRQVNGQQNVNPIDPKAVLNPELENDVIKIQSRFSGLH